MLQDFNASETRRNLMRAFAGESMARNRYTFAAAVAKENHLTVIQRLFEFTAGQEKEHGEIFYNFLQQGLGQTVEIEAGYPVDQQSDVTALLHAAHHNEYEEYGDIYPAFGRTAQNEGFADIARKFFEIAAIEKTHGDRFDRYARLLESGRLFAEPGETRWLCLNCGHIHTGPKAPAVCPVCNHDQGYFIRLDASPF